MPRIAELKEIDGAVWAKLEIATDPSGIGIYTPDEVEGLKRAERSHCRWLIEQSDMPSGWKHRAVDALRQS